MNSVKSGNIITQGGLLTVILTLAAYSEALTQNYTMPPQSYNSQGARILTVEAGSGKGFMALLRDIGIDNEIIVNQAGNALQTSFQQNFSDYNGILPGGTTITYYSGTTKTITVTLPNGGTITATVTGTTKKPITNISVTQPEKKQVTLLMPMTYSTAPDNETARVMAKPRDSVHTANIGSTGFVGAIREALGQDMNLPVESIANQAGTFIQEDILLVLKTDILPRNITISFTQNGPNQLEATVTQTITTKEKVKTGTIKNKAGKHIPTYKTISKTNTKVLSQYIIVVNGNKITTSIHH